MSGVAKGIELPEWVAEAHPVIDGIIAEYSDFDLQFAGENRPKGMKGEGPTAADIIGSARQAAEAFRTLQSFHRAMNAAQLGWDRRYVGEIGALHKAILTEMLHGLQFSREGEQPRARNEFAGAMPAFDPKAAVGFSDPFASVFTTVAANIDRVANEYEDRIRRGRRVDNRFDRLVGRLADLWLEAEGEPAKAGSKRHEKPWPFERLVHAVLLQANECGATGRQIATALRRWNTMSGK